MEPAPSHSHSLPHLPDEITVEILSHNLVHDRDISKTTHSLMFLENLDSIIATRNRRLVGLALEVYYKRNTFIISVAQNYNDTPKWQPSPLQAPLIRSLRVMLNNCGLGFGLEDPVMQRYSAWAWLIRPSAEHVQSMKSPGLRQTNTNYDKDLGWKIRWQHDFMGLRTLKIEVHFRRPIVLSLPFGRHVLERNRTEQALIAYKNMVENFEIELQTHQIEVMVNKYNGDREENTAHRVLEESLRKMVQRKD